MKWIRHVLLALGLLCIAQGPDYVEGYGRFDAADDVPSFTCGYSEIHGTFLAKEAKYRVLGGCLGSPSEIQVPWVAYGTYRGGTKIDTGHVEEVIYINGPSPYRGQIHFAMICADTRTNFDPWLTNGICSAINVPVVEGEIATQQPLLNAIYARVRARGMPLSSTFPYDRQLLLAKRTNDLRAEAEAVAAEMRRAEHLLQGAKQPSGPTGPYTALIHPSVLTPTAGQILYSKSAVSIKLAPPKGWTVTGYTINIQRRDANGTWVNHTTIPIAAATAHSPTGYTGFGGGAPPAFLMLPGKWRLNAQASSPKKSGLSDWVEFNAMTTPDFAAPKRKTPLPF